MLAGGRGGKGTRRRRHERRRSGQWRKRRPEAAAGGAGVGGGNGDGRERCRPGQWPAAPAERLRGRGHGEDRDEPAARRRRASLFVSRPVLAIVLNLLIVVAGLAAFSGIEVRELPNIDQPVITVRTNYTGATPETIDKEITGVIEGAVARTPGVVAISSQSSAGQSQVTVQFSGSTDINVAANDLRDAVGNLRGLPNDSNFSPPTIVKADTNSDAIMRLAATSTTLPIDQLTAVVNDQIVDRLAAVNGVADVQLFGDRDPLVRVIIDPNALAAHGLTIADLDTALGNVALDAPAGKVSDDNQSLLLRADASTKSADEIAAIQVNPTTRVGDVADVVFGPADKTTSLRINGQTGVGLAIVRQASANTLDISKGVRGASPS